MPIAIRRAAIVHGNAAGWTSTRKLVQCRVATVLAIAFVVIGSRAAPLGRLVAETGRMLLARVSAPMPGDAPSTASI